MFSIDPEQYAGLGSSADLSTVVAELEQINIKLNGLTTINNSLQQVLGALNIFIGPNQYSVTQLASLILTSSNQVATNTATIADNTDASAASLTTLVADGAVTKTNTGDTADRLTATSGSGSSAAAWLFTLNANLLTVKTDTTAIASSAATTATKTASLLNSIGELDISHPIPSMHIDNQWYNHWLIQFGSSPRGDLITDTVPPTLRVTTA